MGATPARLRHASRAFLATAVAALVTDALLQTALGAMSVREPGGGAPWWVAAHLVDRGRWVVFAALLVAASWRVRTGAGSEPDAGTIWRSVGLWAMAVPVLWTLAGWLVTAIVFTAARRWDIDGRVFLEPSYYRVLLAAYTPWLLGGAAAIAMSRHVD